MSFKGKGMCNAWKAAETKWRLNLNIDESPVSSDTGVSVAWWPANQGVKEEEARRC